MDLLLQKASAQAVNFAIKSGISLASGYAFKTLRQFVQDMPSRHGDEIQQLEQSLRSKIAVLVPSIDVVEMLASQNNTVLESSLDLIRSLKAAIDSFNYSVAAQTASLTLGKKDQADRAVSHVCASLVALNKKIDEAIPLISLALTTFGAAHHHIHGTLSPSLLLQASQTLIAADQAYSGKRKVPVGPSLSLVYYSIFYSNARTSDGSKNDLTWKEEFARADTQIVRTPATNAKSVAKPKEDYRYILKIQENHNDGRVHDDKPRSVEIAVRHIEKIYFTVTGRLLEVDCMDQPVLILKTASNEWHAFQVYRSAEEDSESGTDSETDLCSGSETLDNDLHGVTAGLSHLDLADQKAPLRFLEFTLRLCSLQTHNQASIMDATDEQLRFYLLQQDEEQHNQDSVDTPSSTRSYRSPLRTRVFDHALTPTRSPRKS